MAVHKPRMMPNCLARCLSTSSPRTRVARGQFRGLRRPHDQRDFERQPGTARGFQSDGEIVGCPVKMLESGLARWRVQGRNREAPLPRPRSAARSSRISMRSFPSRTSDRISTCPARLTSSKPRRRVFSTRAGMIMLGTRASSDLGSIVTRTASRLRKRIC